jgi:Cupin domain
VDFQPHAVAPLHQHPEEQIGTMPEGECEFELNCVKRTIRPGDVYVIPPNVPHSARAYDKALHGPGHLLAPVQVPRRSAPSRRVRRSTKAITWPRISAPAGQRWPMSQTHAVSRSWYRHSKAPAPRARSLPTVCWWAPLAGVERTPALVAAGVAVPTIPLDRRYS